MAKSDTKKAGARSKLPKRIAGIKVPKTLRRSGAKASAWLMSSTGREIVAAGLVAAAAAMTSRKARGAVSEGARDAVSGAGRIGQTLAETAADVVRRTVGDQKSNSGETRTSPARATKRRKGRTNSPSLAH